MLAGVSSNFYPRSPCGERQGEASVLKPCAIFLSTLSLRRATNMLIGRALSVEISIHALLAESDFDDRHAFTRCHNFYPRSPCGERPVKCPGPVGYRGISIHALLAESDYLATWKPDYICHFYPRSPCGERQPSLYQLYDTYAISIHALLAESDVKGICFNAQVPKQFLSTLSLRRATGPPA